MKVPSPIATRAAAYRKSLQDTAVRTPHHGTRRRTYGMAATAFAALVSMFGLVSNNVLAVQFTSANDEWKIYSDRVVGEYAAGYVGAQATRDLAGGNGSTAVAQFGFKVANVDGLCAIAKQDLLGTIGVASIIITGGDPVNGTVENTAGKKITANELYLATDTLTGKGENITSMTLGQSADTLSMDTLTTHRGAPGTFGLQARLMQIANLEGDSYGVDLKGSINMPDLKIRVKKGEAQKSDCVATS